MSFSEYKEVIQWLMLIVPIIVLIWAVLTLAASYHGWALARSTLAWLIGFGITLAIGTAAGVDFLKSVEAGIGAGFVAGLIGGYLAYRRFWQDFFINTIALAGVLGGCVALFAGWEQLSGIHWGGYVLVFLIAFAVVGTIYWLAYIALFPTWWRLWNALKIGVAGVVLINIELRRDVVSYIIQKEQNMDRWAELFSAAALDMALVSGGALLFVLWLTRRQDFSHGWRELVEYARKYDDHSYLSYRDMVSSAMRSLPESFAFASLRDERMLLRESERKHDAGNS